MFPGKRGTVRDKPGVRRALRAALARTGLDVTLRWHDLRHTCASWWVLAGGDIFRLSKLLGHRSVVITERTYAHLAPEAWQQDYARLAFRVPTESAQILRGRARPGRQARWPSGAWGRKGETDYQAANIVSQPA